jgi:hypothetical protein
MKSLRIDDLGAAKELDGRAMSAVRGGTQGLFLPLPMPLVYSPLHVTDRTNFSAQQVVGQSSNIVTHNGNDGAFATIVPSQHATNTINFF